MAKTVLAQSFASTGKVLDFEILPRHCKICTIRYPLKESEPAEYEAWLVSHEDTCQLNHEVSAASMECAAVVNFFLDLFRTAFYGDGDISSCRAVEKIYPEDEYIGHYQAENRQRVEGLDGKEKAK